MPRGGGSRIDSFVSRNPGDSEDDLAWRLIAEIGAEAARLLLPIFERTGGKKGRLSIQVNPKNFGSGKKMIEQAAELAQVAPNVAIKAPATEARVKAIEEMTARGITVTVTFSFTVSQAIHCAQAIERGLERAAAGGIDIGHMAPSVVIMVGRLDDHLRRVMARERITLDPGVLEWAGVAVVKKLHGIFQERRYRSKLLVAAYRNHMHWSEFIGGDLILTIPHRGGASSTPPQSR
jgi:transaldolase